MLRYSDVSTRDLDPLGAMRLPAVLRKSDPALMRSEIARADAELVSWLPREAANITADATFERPGAEGPAAGEGWVPFDDSGNLLVREDAEEF